MLYAFLAVLCYSAAQTTVTAKSCEPSNFLCAGWCPPPPADFELKSEGICFKDSKSEGCVCWLKNPSSRLNSLFQCEAKINGSTSQVLCQTPSHCFPPSPKPGCLIVRICSCLLYNPESPSSRVGQWRAVKAYVHTVKKASEQSEENDVEKVQGEVREFSLKHLLFLLAFVIAPLLCWCLLNFFHEGKCRKKASSSPESQPIPTSRGCTIDSMNAEEGEASDGGTSGPASVSAVQSLIVVRPTAPEILDEVVCAVAPARRPSKCESPPPYFESADNNDIPDCGPPPSYEDAVRGTDINVQQLWQIVFVDHTGARENS